MVWVILIYDIEKSRVNKIRKICEGYLVRVQESAFEGYISAALLNILIKRLKKEIDESYDKIKIYSFREDRKGKIIELGDVSHKDNII
ncbi:CRISPR-associated endonuclease Cas2 [Picrophilus oshimae]|uniref:CRISPR-associated endoribonuclease Cas2 n=1 Tax=Picrophilus torridus (strain ATCC 700027 / DSM 9790 / JCM 10055 / NBRC 100828 / KAW 2/3) TaxID=1122961 RepID=Q6L364_PICTO|nr:CRISPR-associated endonuclease Cas2 [Picrophilus oshimae]AAT42587.1 putative protein involved in DNA replication [Picrophilus oshimae DSM 9789]